MANKDLKTRTPISNAVDTKLLLDFRKLADTTKIPQSKLFDEAIALLLNKYGKM